MRNKVIGWRRLVLGDPSTDVSYRAQSGIPVPAEAAGSVSGYLRDLLAETREELTRADNKASLLLAAVGVVIGALIAGLVGSGWTPLTLNGAVQWLWWLGVASAAIGVFSIAAAVYPRTIQHGTPHPGVPAYYGHVAAYRDISEFRRALTDLPSAQERLVNQTFVISKIVRHKYALLRVGLWCLLLTITACALAVGMGVLLGS